MKAPSLTIIGAAAVVVAAGVFVQAAPVVSSVVQEQNLKMPAAKALFQRGLDQLELRVAAEEFDKATSAFTHGSTSEITEVEDTGIKGVVRELDDSKRSFETLKGQPGPFEPKLAFDPLGLSQKAKASRGKGKIGEGQREFTPKQEETIESYRTLMKQMSANGHDLATKTQKLDASLFPSMKFKLKKGKKQAEQAQATFKKQYETVKNEDPELLSEAEKLEHEWTEAQHTTLYNNYLIREKGMRNIPAIAPDPEYLRYYKHRSQHWL